MKDRVKLTDAGSYYLNNVKRNLKMSGQDNYIPMRIAFARSLQVGKEPNINEKNQEVLDKIKNTKAKEQPPLTLLLSKRMDYFSEHYYHNDTKEKLMAMNM